MEEPAGAHTTLGARGRQRRGHDCAHTGLGDIDTPRELGLCL